MACHGGGSGGAGEDDEFVLPDGTVVEPLRTLGGYRRFTLEMLKDIALSSYRHGWLSMDKLRSVFRELAMAAYGDTGEYKIPGSPPCSRIERRTAAK